MNKHHIFDSLCTHIAQRQQQKPLRVAINGIQGTGKTTFARKFAEYLQSQGVNAIYLTIDGYHHPSAIRYKQGRDSARGYYEDCYDEQAFVDNVLRASQAGTYVPVKWDLANDVAVNSQPVAITNDAILLVDGAFLFKPIYRDYWDLKIYLQTDFRTAMQRGIARDQAQLGGRKAAEQKYLKRYHLASRYYIAENQPAQLADIVIDNTDFATLNINP